MTSFRSRLTLQKYVYPRYHTQEFQVHVHRPATEFLATQRWERPQSRRSGLVGWHGEDGGVTAEHNGAKSVPGPCSTGSSNRSTRNDRCLHTACVLYAFLEPTRQVVRGLSQQASVPVRPRTDVSGADGASFTWPRCTQCRL